MADILNRVVWVDNHKTSIRLARAEWDAFDIICQKENIKKNYLIELINARKNAKLGLTCSVRLFSLIYFYKLFSADENERNGVLPIFEAIRGIA